MGCLGVFFSPDDDDARRLRDAGSDDEVMELVEVIEDRWERAWLCEIDKSWDAIHRCLSNGTLDVDGSPASRLFFGGASLHCGEDYVACQLAPAEVAAAAEAVDGFDHGGFERRYARLGEHGYADASETNLAYSWACFEEMREFVGRVATAGRHLLFTVNQ